MTFPPMTWKHSTKMGPTNLLKGRTRWINQGASRVLQSYELEMPNRLDILKFKHNWDFFRTTGHISCWHQACSGKLVFDPVSGRTDCVAQLWQVSLTFIQTSFHDTKLSSHQVDLQQITRSEIFEMENKHSKWQETAPHSWILLTFYIFTSKKKLPHSIFPESIIA